MKEKLGTRKDHEKIGANRVNMYIMAENKDKTGAWRININICIAQEAKKFSRGEGRGNIDP